MFGLNSIARSILCILVGCSLGTSALAQTHETPLREGFDVQSPEEIRRAHLQIEKDFAHAREPQIFSETEKLKILAGYSYLDPQHLVPTDLLQNAVIYFDANKASFLNQGYITIVDFKPRSDKYRFFLVNLSDGSVERYHTTHGTGSDPQKNGFAEIFGNVINSGKSSLGFIRTAEVYTGRFKRSVRLDGLSKTNSNLRDRAVIVHGWDNVHEANVIEGLSWGCITLDWKLKDAVIDKIKEGSLMYAGVSTAP